MRSRAFWPKSTNTPTRSATRHVVVATRLVADAPLDLLGERLRKAAHVGERQLRLDRREDVQPGRARRLRVRAQTELVHHLAHDQRDLAHERPLAVARRVEVDQQVVGPLDLRHARVPRVQLDAPEVRDPRRAPPRCRRSRRPSSARSGTGRTPRRRSRDGSPARASGGRTRRRRRSGSASCGTAAGGGGGARARRRRRSTRRGRPSSARPPGRTACRDSRPGLRDGRFAWKRVS